MRKGDETRQLIVRTAEALFCARGFEATGVQDILDLIHGSKGGFYHHFASKEELLGVICRQRAEDSARRAGAAPWDEGRPLERLNALLRAMMPFSDGDLPFMAMLTPLLDRPGSAAVRVCYQDALAEAFRPLMADCLEKARAAELIWPVDPGILSPVLTLVNACWYEACLLLLRCFRAGKQVEPGALLALLATCRRSLEVLLDAPYGSIELIPLEDFSVFAVRVTRQMRLGPRPESPAEDPEN